MTDTDDADKKKIKIEEASDEIASQPSINNQTATGQEQQQSSPNQPQELISTECGGGGGQNATLTNETDSVASVSLPTTVITTQRHRMITTAGQIR